jgi:hypothetical protein
MVSILDYIAKKKPRSILDGIGSPQKEHNDRNLYQNLSRLEQLQQNIQL